ncbi:MAG: hypothetical protein KDD48_02160 [Bdellovibrionales bacterium]|nr:hypothetical protein [Bdellovibrionales bacterium]
MNSRNIVIKRLVFYVCAMMMTGALGQNLLPTDQAVGICQYGYKMPQEIFNLNADWFEEETIAYGVRVKGYPNIEVCNDLEPINCNSLNLFLDTLKIDKIAYEPAFAPVQPEYRYLCIGRTEYDKNPKIEPAMEWRPINDKSFRVNPRDNMVDPRVVQSPRPKWIDDLARDMAIGGVSYAIGSRILQAAGFVLVRAGSLFIIINEASLPPELRSSGTGPSTSLEENVKEINQTDFDGYIIIKVPRSADYYDEVKAYEGKIFLFEADNLEEETLYPNIGEMDQTFR